MRAVLPQQQQPHHRVLRLGQAGQGECGAPWGDFSPGSQDLPPLIPLLPPQVWNLANCKLKTNHIGHTGYLNTVTVSPDGSLCASGGKVRPGGHSGAAPQPQFPLWGPGSLQRTSWDFWGLFWDVPECLGIFSKVLGIFMEVLGTFLEVLRMFLRSSGAPTDPPGAQGDTLEFLGTLLGPS